MWFILPVIVLFISKKIKITIFPISVPQVQKKCRKNIQNENTKYICDVFHLLSSKRKWNTDMHVYRAEVTFLIWIGEIPCFFFSIINLGCIIGYCVIFVYYNCTNKIYNRCFLFVSNCFRRFSLVNRSWSVHVSLLIQTRWLFFYWRK